MMNHSLSALFVSLICLAGCLSQAILPHHRYTAIPSIPETVSQHQRQPCGTGIPALAQAAPSVPETIPKHDEDYYVLQINKTLRGKTEQITPDGAFCDILTDDYAIEVDYGRKWAEAIGQSLYYGLAHNRKPGIYLLIDGSDGDKRYYSRCLAVCAKHGIVLRTFRIEKKK